MAAPTAQVQRERNLRYVQRHPDWYEKRKAYFREYYLKNRAHRLEVGNAWRQANPERVSAARRKRLYGVSAIQFAALYLTQCGSCAMCGLTFDPTRKASKPHVDHDHVTGQVRGLLCDACNNGLERLKEDPAILRAAIAYLEGN